MNIALIADLHGNRPATLALEKELSRLAPDRVFCLGDIVGKGPSSDFTFDWAFANCDLILGGNWDYGVGHRQFPRDEFYWEQLGPRRLQRLTELPLEHELTLSGRRIRLFHGRPVMPALHTVISDKDILQGYFQNGRYDAVVYADAHRQALRTLTPGMLVNTGSVGNALGEPRCCFALLEGEDTTHDAPIEFRLRQIGYDRVAAIQDALNAPRVPGVEAFIRELRTGLYSRAIPKD